MIHHFASGSNTHHTEEKGDMLLMSSQKGESCKLCLFTAMIHGYSMLRGIQCWLWKIGSVYRVCASSIMNSHHLVLPTARLQPFSALAIKTKVQVFFSNFCRQSEAAFPVLISMSATQIGVGEVIPIAGYSKGVLRYYLQRKCGVECAQPCVPCDNQCVITS